MNEQTANSSGFEDETVTVIIPFCEAFTPQEMLEAAVETAEQQTGVDVDVMVVEDEDQRGPAWARNLGLERTDTRYVAFLDGDDLWEPDKLERQLRRMDETGAGMCVEGRPGRTTEAFIEGLLTSEIFALTSSVVIDTDRVDARFDESLTRREDHLYMIEVADNVGVCFVEDLFEAGKYEEGMSTRVEKSPEQAEAFFDRLTDVVPAAEKYERGYYRDVFVDIGWYYHGKERHVRALQCYYRSLRNGPNTKAVGAAGLTLLASLYRLPLRTGQRLVPR